MCYNFFFLLFVLLRPIVCNFQRHSTLCVSYRWCNMHAFTYHLNGLLFVCFRPLIVYAMCCGDVWRLKAIPRFKCTWMRKPNILSYIFHASNTQFKINKIRNDRAHSLSLSFSFCVRSLKNATNLSALPEINRKCHVAECATGKMTTQSPKLLVSIGKQMARTNQ